MLGAVFLTAGGAHADDSIADPQQALHAKALDDDRAARRRATRERMRERGARDLMVVG